MSGLEATATAAFDALVRFALCGDQRGVRALSRLVESLTTDDDERQIVASKLWATSAQARVLVTRLAVHTSSLEGVFELTNDEPLDDELRAAGGQQLGAYVRRVLVNSRRDARRRAALRFETLGEPDSIDRAHAAMSHDPSGSEGLLELWRRVVAATASQREMDEALEQLIDLAMGCVCMTDLTEAELERTAPGAEHSELDRRRARDRLQQRHKRAREHVASVIRQLARSSAITRDEALDLGTLLARLVRRQTRVTKPSRSQAP